MDNFGDKHKEKKDPKAHIEELKHGRFSVLYEEKDIIIKKALREGRDPEEALREHEKRLTEATERIREKQKEEAIKGLEREYK